jgi:Activator of Hsp90 ATPase homolog 1-like protein
MLRSKTLTMAKYGLERTPGGHTTARNIGGQGDHGAGILNIIEVLPRQIGVHHLIAKFELVEQGSGTRVVFDHTGFPKGQTDHLAAGWKALLGDAHKFLA